MWCVSMSVLLKSIALFDNQSYQVTLRDGQGEIKTFVLCVEEKSDIRVVTWQDDFAAFFNQNLANASLLFEAVLAFDRAREFTRSADQ